MVRKLIRVNMAKGTVKTEDLSGEYAQLDRKSVV